MVKSYVPAKSNNPYNSEIEYQEGDTTEEEFEAKRAVSTKPARQSSKFPFFVTSDSALRAAYSYGDPRGGAYPDPRKHQLQPAQPIDYDVDEPD
jgi:hypothetical protein